MKTVALGALLDNSMTYDVMIEVIWFQYFIVTIILINRIKNRKIQKKVKIGELLLCCWKYIFFELSAQKING